MPKLEPMSQPMARSSRRARGARVSSSLAEINIVPLVDVMLVLLVIFMVAAPMMQQGFPVNLPQSSQSRAISAPVIVTVPLSFKKDRRVQVGDEFMPLAVLAERVRQQLETQESKRVIVSGDGGITLAEFMIVSDQLQAGGVENVGLQTQPATDRSR
jgi:biopolymer transport protein ExbD